MTNLSVVFIILLSLFDVKALDNNIYTNKCADCRKYLAFCKISEYGYLIELWADIEKVVRNSNYTDYSLAECVPDKFQITELMEGSACFWSPELGCHKLLGRLEQKLGFNDLSCVDCLSRCPCAKGFSPFTKSQLRLSLICLSIIMFSSSL